MTKRNLDLTCRHCLRSYDEEGQDYGNYGTGLCFTCFEETQETPQEQLQRRRLEFVYG